MEISEWKNQVNAEREQKDGFFKMHPQPPLLFDQRQEFGGLNYYPPDPNYRIECPFQENGFLILTRFIILGVHTVKIMFVLLCRRTTGLRLKCVLARKLIRLDIKQCIQSYLN
jgi:hypothetical protein